MKENKYQTQLKKKIEERLPGSMVLKQDPNRVQGIPDLIVLHENNWAALEVKKDKKSSKQFNQDWYVNTMNDMSFARTIYPENEEEVLDELQQTFQHRR